MSVKDLPHYRLPATALAEWIEGQPERWWSVDGDNELMSRVLFPCPVDELAPEIRKIGKDLLVYDRAPESTAHGQSIGSDKLEALVDTRNNGHWKTLVLTWADSTEDWLLVEDEAEK